MLIRSCCLLWFLSLLERQEVKASDTRNRSSTDTNLDGTNSSPWEDGEILYPNGDFTSLVDDPDYGLEEYSFGEMTVKERADTAEQLYEKFVLALHELSLVDTADFPELGELLQENLKELEKLQEPFKDSIHFIRLAAEDEEAVAPLGPDMYRGKKEISSNENLQDLSTLSQYGDADATSTNKHDLFGDAGAEEVDSKLDVSADRKLATEQKTRAGRTPATLKRANKGKKMTSYADKEQGFFQSSFLDFEKQMFENQNDLNYFLGKSKTPDVVREARRMLSRHKSANSFRLLDGVHEEKAGRRRLKTKDEKCQQLAECANNMSLYDLFVLFNSDDIDPATGSIDTNRILFDETDIMTRQTTIKSLATSILDNGEFSNCNALLEQFYRVVEFDGVPQWEGATVSQVCLAEGTTVYVDFGTFAFGEGFFEQFEDSISEAAQNYMDLDRIQDQSILSSIEGPLEQPSQFEFRKSSQAERAYNAYVRSTVPVNKLVFSPGSSGDHKRVVLTTSNPATLDPSCCDNFRNDAVHIGLFERSRIHFPNGEHADVNGYSLSDEFILQVEGNTVNFYWNGDLLTTFSNPSGQPLYAQLWFYEPNSSLTARAYEESRNHDTELASILEAVDSLMNAPKSKLDVFRSFAAEPFQCAEELFESRDTLNEDEGFVFLRSGSPEDFSWRIPSDVSTTSGRTSFGQINGDGISALEFKSGQTLMQEFESCLEDPQRYSSWRGFGEIFQAVNDQLPVNRGVDFHQCSESTVCSKIESLALVPSVEVHCQNDIIAPDNKYCCPRGDDENLFTEVCSGHCSLFCTGGDSDPKCCRDSIETSSVVCAIGERQSENGCIIPEGERWHDMVLQEASEQFEGGTEVAECISDFFGALQHGLELVFGPGVSTGFICGIKNAVKEKGKSLPGSCCLDAPFQLTDDSWGSPYKCSMVCQNKAPWFAGISEEACDVYGGTWCPSPTDCSVLQTCIADLSEDAKTKNAAYAMYLESAPAIENSADYEQCGAAREYFGFDPDFINDIQICDDIEQLRFSRDFTFLEAFFGQGTELTPEAPTLDAPEAPEQPEDNEPDPIPPFTLTDITRGNSSAAAVQNGQAWRATNFALTQTVGLAQEKVELLQVSLDVCPLGKGTTINKKFASFTVFKFHDLCRKVVGSQWVKTKKALRFAQLGLEISEFTYGELGEIDNIGPIRTMESVDAIFDRMVETGNYLRDRFEDLSYYIEEETDILKTILADQNTFLTDSLEAKSDFLEETVQFESNQRSLEIEHVTELVEALLLHFGVEFTSRRKLDGFELATLADRVDETRLPTKDSVRTSPSSSEAATSNFDECFLHGVQVEIVGTKPKGFICGIMRYEDADVSLELMDLEAFDADSETMVVVSAQKVVDLGNGRLLIKIPESMERNNLFSVRLGLKDKISNKIVANHSQMVTFPIPQEQ